jgi:hypothetical protein
MGYRIYGSVSRARTEAITKLFKSLCHIWLRSLSKSELTHQFPNIIGCGASFLICAHFLPSILFIPICFPYVKARMEQQTAIKIAIRDELNNVKNRSRTDRSLRTSILLLFGNILLEISIYHEVGRSE